MFTLLLHYGYIIITWIINTLLDYYYIIIALLCVQLLWTIIFTAAGCRN